MGDRVGGILLHSVIQGPRILPSWSSTNCKGLQIIHWMLCIWLEDGREIEPRKGTHALNPLSLEMTHITSAQILSARPHHMAPRRCKGGWEMVFVCPRWRGNRFRKHLARLQEESGGVPCVIMRVFDILQMHPPSWCSCGSTSADLREHSMRLTCLAPFAFSPLPPFFSRKTSCILENCFYLLIDDPRQLPKE